MQNILFGIAAICLLVGPVVLIWGLVRRYVWPRKPGGTLIRNSGLLILAAIIVAVIFRPADEKKAQTAAVSASAPVASEPAAPAVPEHPWPDDQKAFIEAVTSAIGDYDAAPNELKKSSIRLARDRAVKGVMGDGKFSGWVVALDDLGTNGDGDAYVSFKIEGEPITLKTWNNGLSDISDHTMIKNGSALYEVLAGLNKGDLVKLSGRILREGSLTEAGSVTDPEYLVRIAAVVPLAK